MQTEGMGIIVLFTAFITKHLLPPLPLVAHHNSIMGEEGEVGGNNAHSF
jgi:hypothetical protein